MDVSLGDHDAGCIPSDVRIGGEDASCMIVSGANYSGKSVLMKTVGMLQIMAQVGCFVPARRAEIGICDRLFTRIESTETSLGYLESSFTLDVQQVSKMLKHATPNCMLLIDEFGKGTQSTDGMSLLAATVKHLCSASAGAPRTIVTTHFLELFECGVLKNEANMTLHHMQVDVTEGGVVPLFRLLAGRSQKSYGMECAARAGVPDEVIARMNEILKILDV